MNINVAGNDFLAILLVLWSLFVTIFFMVCAWRAMQAHEGIAESMRTSPGRKQDTRFEPPAGP